MPRRNRPWNPNGDGAAPQAAKIPEKGAPRPDQTGYASVDWSRYRKMLAILRANSVMDEGVMLALTRAWWSWNTPAIHNALTAAHLKHWLPQVEAALKANADSGEQPAEWAKFTALRRNPRNIRRVVQGKSSATPGFLLGIAAMLRLEVHSLYPTTLGWIADATTSLCKGKFSDEDCRVYVEFTLRRPTAGSASCRVNVEEELRTVAVKARTIVLRVAQVLGPVLQRAHCLLEERESSQ